MDSVIVVNNGIAYDDGIGYIVEIYCSLCTYGAAERTVVNLEMGPCVRNRDAVSSSPLQIDDLILNDERIILSPCPGPSLVVKIFVSFDDYWWIRAPSYINGEVSI